MTFKHAAGTLLFALAMVSPGMVSATAESAPTATAPEAVPPVTAANAGLVQAIEEHYRVLADLSAKVMQKNYFKSADKTQTFSGTLSVKRPGRLRLEYTNGQVIVIEGGEAWFYSKQNSQAIRRIFQDFEQANIPVAFLLGAGAIRKDFDVAAPATGMLDLVPKKAGAAMQKLRLYAGEDGRISRMIVYDRSGNRSDIQFSDVRENAGLDDALFRFKAPKGTEVIEQ